MNKFILQDDFIESIRKNINKLKDFYNKNIDSLYFTKLPYNDRDHHLSILLQPKKNEDWESLKKRNLLFQEIFEIKNVIIPTVSIARMLPYPNRESFIAHKHIYDIDDKIYHVIMKTNSKSGIIIENEYLPYTEDLVFGFKANKKHIVFNFGETIKDSYVFVMLSPNYTLEQWFEQKMKYAMINKYEVEIMNQRYALKQIKKLTFF